MPSLEALNRKFHGKDFVVLGVDIQESRNTVLSHAQQNGISYLNLLDENGDVSARYGVRSTPMKYLIDTEGNIVGAAIGYREWDNEQMISLIQKLIDEG